MDYKRGFLYTNFLQYKAPILDEGSKCKTCTPIICYFDGFKYICPDPHNNNISTYFKQQYEMGEYFNKQIYYIPQKHFYNSNNWKKSVHEREP
jgi:hypothetical protein